jgi:hypothetical protein
MNAVRDEKRGIQNVQQRISDIPSRETVGARHLRGGKWQPEAANDAAVIQAANDEQAYFAAAAVAQAEEEEESVAQEQLQRTLIEKSKKLLVKKTLGRKTLISRQAIRYSLGIAGTAYLFQLLFAVGAILGFGAQGLALYTRHETTLGRFLGIVFEYQNYLPFEGLGYIFWGLGLLLSLAMFIGYLFFFLSLGITILQSSIMVAITALCFTLNIIPFFNIFPWLLIWVIYMSLFSSSD